MTETCFTFAVTMPMPWVDPNGADQFIKAIDKTPGFMAVHPEYPYVMLIYDTLEHAVRARDTVQEMGQSMGDNIMNAKVNRETGTLTVYGPAWGIAAKEGQ